MEIISEFRVYPNREGRKIAAFWDRADNTNVHDPFVVMAPKFGESKKNNLQLAYHLAANGLNVFRFDHLDHIGESDGNIMDYTFRGATNDILDTVSFLSKEFNANELILLANSMSVRPGIRATAEDSRIARFISLAGMVNFRGTSRVVYQADMVDQHMKGEVIGITDILGHEVHVSRFLSGTIEENMHDLTGTLEDVQKASSDFFFICGENDAWIQSQDMQALSRCREDLHLRWISGALHEFRENPKAAQDAMLDAVFASKHGYFPSEEERETLVIPERATIFRQNKVEREKLKKANPLVEREQSFWQNYLQKYGVLEEITDYQKYLALVGECLGTIEAEDCLFDIGCGNGLFGVWCIRELMRDKPWSPDLHPVYFGLDLTPKGLRDALQKQAYAGNLARKQTRNDQAWMDFIYLPYDLEWVGRPSSGGPIQLPFEDNTFNKICCSLLISYLKHPDRILRECHRVLQPGGRIVVSSMKPYCDLSLLYRDLVEESTDEDLLNRARNLLSAAGAIRLKEEQGHYSFFSREELTNLATESGFAQVQAFRSFGDQANLIVATK